MLCRVLSVWGKSLRHIWPPASARIHKQMVTNRPSPLVTLVHKVDEECAATAEGDAPDLKERHKKLIRAAGRAAIEETLLNPERPGSEMTPESLAAEWLAYAEVFGTNGMAGAGRHTATDTKDVSQSPVEHAEPTRRGYVVATAVGVLAIVALVLRHHRTIAR
jgi:hypothetical protein